MRNHSANSFVYAVDSGNQIHMVMVWSYDPKAWGYKYEIRIKHKTYSVFQRIADNGDITAETVGTDIPYIGANDCCSYFSGRLTAYMAQAIKEADLEELDIVKFVCLDFERFGSQFCYAEGLEITPNGESCVDGVLLEKAISSNKDIKSVADYVIHQLI